MTVTIKQDPDNPERYRCPYPGCDYSSSHCEAYGGFEQAGRGWYCPEHVEHVRATLASLGL